MLDFPLYSKWRAISISLALWPFICIYNQMKHLKCSFLWLSSSIFASFQEKWGGGEQLLERTLTPIIFLWKIEHLKDPWKELHLKENLQTLHPFSNPQFKIPVEEEGESDSDFIPRFKEEEVLLYELLSMIIVLSLFLINKLAKMSRLKVEAWKLWICDDDYSWESILRE